MKLLITFCSIFLLCCGFAIAQIPTYAGLPDSSHVLVVYNSLDQTSIDVKDYYKLRRGIPEDNIVKLEDLVNADIFDPVSNTTHRIEITQEGEIISDSTILSYNPIYRHSWLYFVERIASPIAEKLRTTVVNGDTLKNTIRFIVLCKGVPFRILTTPDHSGSCNQNVPADGLLCFLGEDINNPYHLMDYLNMEGAVNGNCQGLYEIKNPYYNADPNFSMDHMFLPNRYSKYNSHFDRDITLSYLITHLDGMSVDDVKNMIDSSIAAINSSGYDWFIDSDPTPCAGGSQILRQSETKTIFDALGINNYFIDGTETVYTSHPNDKPVMSYISNGTHTSEGTLCVHYFQPDFIQSQLSFTYAAGSVFNTAESFNINTLGTDPPIRRDGAEMGQIPEFFHMGGTVGVGQVVHGPFSEGGIINDNAIMLPAYALGYSFIESAYLGMEYLTATRVAVGDPLTRIALPCDPLVISQNTILNSGDYECDIIVPSGFTLTIISSASQPVNFIHNAQLKVEGNLELNDNSYLNFQDYSQLEISNTGDITFSNVAQINFLSRARLNMDIDFEITTGKKLYFYHYSIFQENGILTMAENSELNFFGASQLITNDIFNLNTGSALNFSSSAQLIANDIINIGPGTELNFSQNSQMKVYGTFNCVGEESNKVILNFSNSIAPQLYIIDGDGIEVDNTIINNGDILFQLNSNQSLVDYFSITNSTFNNTQRRAAILTNLKNVSIDPIPLISNCTFNNCSTTAIYIAQAPEINVEYCSINLEENKLGINLSNVGTVEIIECHVRSEDGGIGVKSDITVEDDIEIITELEADVNITQCSFTNLTTGIIANQRLAPYNNLNIYANHFDSCQTAVYVNDFSDYSPLISENIISGITSGQSDVGIFLTNGDQAVVSNNSIANYLTGIQVNNVSNPSVINNFISAEYLTVDPLSGIVFNSSNGQIRKNTIQYHSYGVELGGSSPKMAENIITNNEVFGLYVSAGSFPDLGLTASGPITYPLTGYNEIRENGCEYAENSEIYFNESGADLDQGCNTIADDRVNSGNCDYTILLDGFYDESEILATENYWGDHPVYGHDPSQRIGSGISVDYSHYLSEPCTFSPSGGMLVMTTTNGIVIDTLYSSGSAPTEQTDIEERYASANEYFYNYQFTEAKQGYSGIVQNYGNEKASLKAYHKLYSIEKMLGSSPETFQQLKSFYLQKAGEQTDSLMTTALTHLSNLSLVSAGEYETAIYNFDQIVQQNPNTDLALYREIDALTTALLLPQDSTLNKQAAGRYYVSGIDDYGNKVRELLRTRKAGMTENGNEIIPKEYTLYQNYPNPFNPTTTIKFDLPKAGNVELIIYDILGRKVTALVNETRQAGRYEIQFDASKVASGIYIYQLRTENFVNAKKMMLLK